MDPVEIFAAASGFLAVLLAVRNRVENWPVGIASCAVFVVVFAQARLYISLGLQLLYIGTSIFGWWSWRHRGPEGQTLPVRTLPLFPLALVFVGSILAVLPVGWLLSHSANPAPYWDAAIGTFTLVAMLLMARRFLPHWYFWTVANLLGMGLYARQGLYFTALLWASYQALCVAGMISWRKLLNARAR